MIVSMVVDLEIKSDQIRILGERTGRWEAHGLFDILLIPPYD